LYREVSMIRTPLLAFPALTVVVTMALFTLGCPKKPPPPAEVDAGAEPEVIDAGVTQLEPLDEDSGPETGPAAPPPRGGGGGGGGTNAARIKQCCNGMRKQAAGMGPSPEANIVLGLAMQCDMIAAQAAGGTAPEFGAFRQMISGRTLPAACSGL
jgi:hypothetical protein